MTNNDNAHGIFNKTTYILTQSIPVYTGGVAMVSASAPSDPAEGNWWYNTTNDHLSRYNGTEWRRCDGAHKTLTNFPTIDEAKNWFYTSSALEVFDECCTQLQWNLQGDNKELKYTMAFGLRDGVEPWTVQFNSRRDALISANNWSKNGHATQIVDSHLF